MSEPNAAKIAADAIDLFLMFRDQHAYDEDNARAAAILELAEGNSVDLDALRAELAATVNETEPTDQ